MQKLSRQIAIEVLWLILSMVLTISLAAFLFGWTFLSGNIILHLHDTDFVISRWLILITLLFLTTFLVYFIKELRKSFSRIFPNWLIMITGLTLVVLLTFQIKSFSQFLLGGWTLYPPLSALGPDKFPEITEDPAWKFITNFLTLIQFFVLLMLLFLVYRWGRQKP